MTFETPVRFAVPVMNEFESQNKSVALPLTDVKDDPAAPSIVERLLRPLLPPIEKPVVAKPVNPGC